jgi:double-stranded uracil-DNA glycosylase
VRLVPLCEHLDRARIHHVTVLPDVLAPHLRVVFCGTAAGSTSARRGAYYAGSGNKFWPMLYAIGLTPRQLPPTEFASVLRYGIGLTDLCKLRSGSDVELGKDPFDGAGLEARVHVVAPRVIAFNGV